MGIVLAIVAGGLAYLLTNSKDTPAKPAEPIESAADIFARGEKAGIEKAKAEADAAKQREIEEKAAKQKVTELNQEDKPA